MAKRKPTGGDAEFLVERYRDAVSKFLEIADLASAEDDPEPAEGRPDHGLSMMMISASRMVEDAWIEINRRLFIPEVVAEHRRVKALTTRKKTSNAVPMVTTPRIDVDGTRIAIGDPVCGTVEREYAVQWMRRVTYLAFGRWGWSEEADPEPVEGPFGLIHSRHMAPNRNSAPYWTWRLTRPEIRGLRDALRLFGLASGARPPQRRGRPAGEANTMRGKFAYELLCDPSLETAKAAVAAFNRRAAAEGWKPVGTPNGLTGVANTYAGANHKNPVPRRRATQ